MARTSSDATRPIDPALAARLYEQSGAQRWGLTIDQFQASIAASVEHAFGGRAPSVADVGGYLLSLHLEDLALAAACAAGHEPAWEHFVREHRPLLFRAADAIDPTGRARELADSLYADLFGLREQHGVRQSLFRYFHGRSRLATWLRAVLSQRHVDALRAARRLDPLPDDVDMHGRTVDRGAAEPGPDRARWMAMMHGALATAVAAQNPRDRLRLNCYYAQDLTLAAIGRLLREHEATVSRHLTRTRRLIRESIEAHLRREHGLDDLALAECFRSVIDDTGSLDLAELIGAAEPVQEPPAGSFK